LVLYIQILTNIEKFTTSAAPSSHHRGTYRWKTRVQNAAIATIILSTWIVLSFLALIFLATVILNSHDNYYAYDTPANAGASEDRVPLYVILVVTSTVTAGVGSLLVIMNKRAGLYPMFTGLILEFGVGAYLLSQSVSVDIYSAIIAAVMSIIAILLSIVVKGWYSLGF